MMNFFIKHPFARNIIFIAVAVIVIVTLVMFAGWYPILIVSGTPIFASEYQKAYDLSYRYYSFVSQADQTAHEDSELRTQLKPVALEGLVDAVLVQKELVNRVGTREMRRAVDGKVNLVWSNAESRNILLNMTGSSEGAVRKLYLEPEARMEVLRAMLQQDGFGIGVWLIQARKEANVKVFLPGVSWTDEGIVIQ